MTKEEARNHNFRIRAKNKEMLEEWESEIWKCGPTNRELIAFILEDLLCMCNILDELLDD